MKTLSLTQPWASLVAAGAKRIETRSWGTQYRGPLAIHAAKAFPRDAQILCYSEPFASALSRAGYDLATLRIDKQLPLGAVIAVVQLVDCEQINEDIGVTEPELSFGDFTPGRYMWFLQDVRQLKDPVPATGSLGLWEWDPSARKQRHPLVSATLF